MRRSFVIEETEDGIITNRIPRTEEEHQRLDAALRGFAAKKVDELARKAVERGLAERITYRDMKKAVRQIKKSPLNDDCKLTPLILWHGSAILVG